MSLTCDDVVYSGVFCQMKDEAGTEVMTFSAVGDNQSVGGRSIEAYVLVPAAWRLKW